MTSQIVEEQYKKDKNLCKKDVKHLMEWMEKQKHFPQITEFQAITFLHSNYYDLEGAIATAENYFSHRTLCADLFYFTDHRKIIEEVLGIIRIGVLPETTETGNPIIVSKMIDSTTSRYSHLNFLRVIDMVAMVNLYTSGVSDGLIFIFDSSGVKFGHLLRTSLKYTREFATYFQKAFPMRLREIHFVNTSSIIKTMVNFARPFLGNEILNLLHFHGDDFTEVHKRVAKEILPPEFKGRGRSLDELSHIFYDNLIRNVEVYEWLQKQKVDETNVN